MGMRTMATQTPAALSARERLLAAANELFYAEGVQTVGIDRVVKHAGVAKASLYNTFGSKDELIRAYLEGRHAERREWFIAELSAIDNARERLLAAFDLLGQSFAEEGFHGCAFVKATAEAVPNSAAIQASDAYRAWVREMFLELAQDAGAPDPRALAKQLHLLYDGAGVAARMDRDPSAAEAARQVAAALVTTNAPQQRPRRRTAFTQA
jgi:AcrR family transcriptional regulator